MCTGYLLLPASELTRVKPLFETGTCSRPASSGSDNTPSDISSFSAVTTLLTVSAEDVFRFVIVTSSKISTAD